MPCGSGLAEGVPLTLEVDLDVERVRQLLPNSGVAELTQRYHLQYNAVSARYILRNENSGQQESLRHGRGGARVLSVVRGLPVLDKALLPPGPALRGERARQGRLRQRAVQPAHADVLGQRMASRKRLVHMDAAAVIRKHGSTVLGGTRRRAVAGRAVPAGLGRRRIPPRSTAGCRGYLLINIAGLLTLLVLLAGKLLRLVRDLPPARARFAPEGAYGGDLQRPGAWRPILVVYYFALQFLNRGIDSWFELEVSQGLRTRASCRAPRSTCACGNSCRTPRPSRTHAVGAAGFRADRHPGPRAAREHGAGVHRGGRADADHRHQLRPADGQRCRCPPPTR